VLLILAVAFLRVGHYEVRSHAGGLPGHALFWFAAYCLLAGATSVYALRWITHFQADPDRWRKNEAKVRKWLNASLGLMLIGNSAMYGKILVLEKPAGVSLSSGALAVVLSLGSGALSLYFAFTEKPAKQIGE